MNYGKRFVFTLNGELQADALANTLRGVEAVDKFGVADEHAPTTGQHHIQGFVVMSTPFSFMQMKEVIGSDRVHIQIMRGGIAANIRYISKESPPILHNCAASARLSQLDGSVKMTKEQGLKRVAVELPAAFVRHHRGLTAYQSMLLEPYEGPRLNFWLYGAAGSGKSFIARRLASLLGLQVYPKVVILD